MNNEIVVALIGLLGVVITALINRFSKDMNSRLDRLEKKVDLHNGYAQKFESCDSNIKLCKKDISWIKEEIKEIKNE